MRDGDAVRHRYRVPGWGVGELVVRDGVLVSHALPSKRRTLFPGEEDPQGGASTPEVTVAGEPARMGCGFVPDLCRRFESHLHGTTSEKRLAAQKLPAARAARGLPARAARPP